MDDKMMLNESLHNAWSDIKKIDAMMAAYEVAYLEFDVPTEELSRRDNAERMFYGIWDAVKAMADKIEQYAL